MQNLYPDTKIDKVVSGRNQMPMAQPSIGGQVATLHLGTLLKPQ